jgi:hypothetical protein
MTCRDFQHKWDELLDAEARLAASPDGAGPTPTGTDPLAPADAGEAVLLAHAAGCPDCRAIAARYQVLRHAIRAWRQPPVPPPDLVDRILAEYADLTPGMSKTADRRGLRWWRPSRSQVALLTGLAAAVMVCMLLGVTVDRLVRRHRADHEGPSRQLAVRSSPSVSGSEEPTAGSTALNRALAEATSATWDLARSASEPAARISRDVLDATTQGDPRPNEAGGPSSTDPPGAMEGLASLSVPMPSLDPLAPDASTVLQQVGDHLSAGVQPLSSTARHAFSFLLGPPRDRTEPRATGRAASGA